VFEHDLPCLSMTVQDRGNRRCRLTRVSGHAERPRAVTLGADRGHDAADFCRRIAHAESAPACGAEHQGAALGDRPAHDASPPAAPPSGAAPCPRREIRICRSSSTGPTLAQPINGALIRQQDGSYALVWNRKELKADEQPAEAEAAA